MSEEIKQYEYKNKPVETAKKNILNFFRHTWFGRFCNIAFWAFALLVANGLFNKPFTAISTCVIILIVVIRIYTKNRENLSSKSYWIELPFYCIVFIGVGFHLYNIAVKEGNYIDKIESKNKVLSDSIKTLNDTLQRVNVLVAAANQQNELSKKYFEAGKKPNLLMYPLHIDTSRNFIVTADLENIGSMDAININFIATMSALRNISAREFIINKSNTVGSFEISSKEKKSITISYTSTISPAEKMDIFNGKIFLFVFGIIRFQDEFGNVYNKKFCQRYNDTLKYFVDVPNYKFEFLP